MHTFMEHIIISMYMSMYIHRGAPIIIMLLKTGKVCYCNGESTGMEFDLSSCTTII